MRLQGPAKRLTIFIGESELVTGELIILDDVDVIRYVANPDRTSKAT